MCCCLSNNAPLCRAVDAARRQQVLYFILGKWLDDAIFSKFMLIEKLSTIGLTEREASVYVMLLRIGPSLVSPLARRLGVKRVTMYSVLESLQGKGLARSEETVNGRRYLPLEPGCLLDHVEQEFCRMRTKLELAKECVLELNKMESLSGEHNKTISFKGKNAILAELNQCLNEGATLTFSSDQNEITMRCVLDKQYVELLQKATFAS